MILAALPLLLAAPQSIQLLEMDKIVSPSPAPLFAAGRNSVAFDGRTLLVAHEGASALQVFRRTDSGWVHVQTILQPVPEVTHFPGCFDLDGDVLVCGARTSAPEDRVWVWREVGGVWTLEQELSTGTSQANSLYGFSFEGIETVAVSGDAVVVGARQIFRVPGASHDGAAYVWRDSGSGWVLEDTLFTADETNERGFGASVAFDGERILVGDPVTTTGPVPLHGRVHVFARVAGAWSEEAILWAPVFGPFQFDMGSSLGIDGDTLAFGNGRREVGGAVEVFERVGGAWLHRRKLTASGGVGFYGSDVEVDDTLVFVGGTGQLGSTSEPEGRVYVYVDDQDQWSEAAVVAAFDQQDGHGFGFNLEVADRTLVVANRIAPNANGVRAVYTARYCPELGTMFCPSSPNSTGRAASLCAAGSGGVLDQDVTMIGHDLPGGQFAMLFMSESEQSVPGFAGSQGVLCVGGVQRIYRYAQHLFQVPSTGTAYMEIPWANMPENVQLLPGATWSFQLWFRDVVGGAATSNTTGGLRISFQ